LLLAVCVAAENEVNVRHVLDTYPYMQLVPAEPLVGGPGLRGPADAARFAAVLAQKAAEEAGNPNASVVLAAQEAAAVLEAVSSGQHKDGWLSEQQARMVQRFCPESDLDTIGFFVSKFQKVCSCVWGSQAVAAAISSTQQQQQSP
jgi:16S rRNA C967 or C1407 C5-methylase (RsmB/RsmF family)